MHVCDRTTGHPARGAEERSRVVAVFPRSFSSRGPRWVLHRCRAALSGQVQMTGVTVASPSVVDFRF